MNKFNIRQQYAETGNVTSPVSCKWIEIINEFISITIEGKYETDLLIDIKTTERTYSITGEQLEAILAEALPYDQDNGEA